jgi:basic membrane lipoprotein Med (substrate-binding protein (PBP1-ABC) superfamily)
MKSMADQESRLAYINARKLAKKYVSDYADTETKGYLPVLDERLRSVVIVGEINLGYHEIPLSKIIGTKTSARSNSFAGNFMPLLSEDTEFAQKWQAVYTSQLNEGIREPITVYEYINRYYVLEGNKRVSILKYVGAASIYGNIIRLLPERDESNTEISIYYEFLDFDKRLFFNNLWFSRKGSFTRLVRQTQHFLKHHPEIKSDIGTVINHVHRIFREAYKSVNLKGLRFTTGDALVEYIGVFGYPYYATAKELKKNIRNAYSQFLVAAGERTRESIEVSQEQGATYLSKTGIFKSPNRITVALAFEGTPETSLWTRFHVRAIDRIENKYKEYLKVERLYNVSLHGSQCYRDIAGLAEKKPDILFTTNPAMSNASLRIALENPDIIVLNCDTPHEGKNLHTYFFKMYDLTFLCGVLSAAMSETGRLGYMSTGLKLPTYELNAFAIGARMINPRTQVFDFAMTGVNDWKEHDKARYEFARHGADIAFCLHSPDNPLDRKAFPEVYAQIYRIDRNKGYPLESLAGASFDWEPYYEKVISDAIIGKSSLLIGHMEGNPIHFGWGLSTGVMDIFPVNSVIGVAGRLLRIFRDLIKENRINPFEGPIYDNQGNMRIDWNYVPTLMEIQEMDWYESCVSGINHSV